MKYTQQPVAVGGLPSHTQQTHTHVCVAYTMMMIVCVLRLFKKREIPMSTDGDLHFRTHKRLFPFRRFLSDYTHGNVWFLYFYFYFLRLTLSQVPQKTLKNKYLSLSLLYMNKNSCLSLSLFPSSTQLFFFVWVRRLYSPEMVFDASPVYV